MSEPNKYWNTERQNTDNKRGQIKLIESVIVVLIKRAIRKIIVFNNSYW